MSERGAGSSTLAEARESLTQTLERLVDDCYLYVEQRDEIEKKVRAIESAMAIRPDPTPRLPPIEIEDGFGV